MIHPCVKIAKRCTNSHHIKLFSISLKSHWSSLADFRSDTVTKPCDNMRNAMLRADVGDDVYGEGTLLNLTRSHVLNELSSRNGRRSFCE